MGPGQNPRRRRRDTSTQAGPFGILTGMGRGQDPAYHSHSAFSTGRQSWRQNSRLPNVSGTVPFPSSGRGPRDGGHFGIMNPNNGYAHASIYPGEATTDPSYQPSRWGPDRGRGFGELVPGIDGGNGYGYRETPPRFALAEWGSGQRVRLTPHIPGRPGLVRDHQCRGQTGGDSGYDHAAYPGAHPQGRGFGDRAKANMEQQIEHGG